MKQNSLSYSVVIPVFNEEGAILSLGNEIIKVMERLGKPYEIIVVNDGSTDKTADETKKIKGAHLINLRSNFGQSTALDIGIKRAKGEIIITLDGDGQNNPADIPSLLDKLSKDVDFVCGWRKNRKDDFRKRFVSRGANQLRRILIDDGVHDAGCTLRVYKKDCFVDLDLNGEMHRMIPAILKWRGFKGMEIIVDHRPRKTGVTKYDNSRIIKGFLDMLLVWFGKNFQNRPLHLFGAIGLILMIFSSILLVCLAYLKLFWGYQLSNKIWPLVGMNSFLAGLQLLIFGFLADLIRKNNTKTNRWIIKDET